MNNNKQSMDIFRKIIIIYEYNNYNKKMKDKLRVLLQMCNSDR